MSADEQTSRQIGYEAHCGPCGRDVVTGPSGKCPDCGTETRVASRSKPKLVPIGAVTEPARPTDRAEAAAPEPSQSDKKLVLPPHAAVRRFEQSRQALLDDLLKKEAAAKGKYDALVARQNREREAAADEVRRLRRARAGLEQISSLIVIEAVAAPTSNGVASERRRSPAPLGGAWSRAHEACVDCGSTERRHASLGRCGKCAQAYRKRLARGRRI